MTEYTIHTTKTVPEDVCATMDKVQSKYGFIPNLLGIMAEAPGLLHGYLALSGLFENGTLSATEQQIVLLTTSYENRCEYCMGAHSAIASMQKVPSTVVEALRDGAPLDDPKLESLRRLTASVVVTRGLPEQDDLQRFFAAGYGQAQLFEVILGVGIKTLSNYTNHISETPLDDAFSEVSWQHPDTRTMA